MPVSPVIKMTLIFQTNSYGWSESFLTNTGTSDLNAQMASLQIIAQKRAALLGSQSYIKAERCSVEADEDGNPVVGDSILKYIRYNGPITNTSADEDIGVLITMRNALARHRRNMFLRGIWDDTEGAGGFYLPATPGWQTAFDSWAAAMLSKGVGWWHYSKSDPFTVDGYTVDPVTGYVTVTVLGDAFGAGPYQKQRIRLQGVNVKSQINGVWVATPVSASQIILEKPMGLVPYAGGGVLYTYTRLFDLAQTLDAQKITTRRAGAPLLQSRGRSRAKPRT